ncbi:MAG: DUF5103 domain-containing protein [Mangrovibacterium sp.]
MSILYYYQESAKIVLSFLGCIMFLLNAPESSAAERYYENKTFKKGIKTVQLYQANDPLTIPIIQLGTEEYLTLKFDELNASQSDYYYTVLHCDADWKESYIMQSEYLDGFLDNPLNDYALSFNTKVEYTNYLLELPNENMSFRYSGNYILVVYEGNNRENVVLTRRFYVMESKVNIAGRLKPATFDGYQGENQELDFEVNFAGFQFNDPNQEAKIVLQKNRRWDSAVRGLKPRYFQDKLLNYNYDEENVFPGGNEFRYFDMRSWRYTGEGVAALHEFNDFQHVTLNVDELRSNKKYFYYAEMNGLYRVESQDREIQDYDTECDYAFVHFTLKMPQPLVGGKVCVFGALTNQELSDRYAMTWNFDTKQYELSLLLKQAYYNYQYVYLPDGETQADETVIEGSFYETENDYQVFVYYRKQNSGRYDRLVGFREFDSINNRNME